MRVRRGRTGTPVRFAAARGTATFSTHALQSHMNACARAASGGTVHPCPPGRAAQTPTHADALPTGASTATSAPQGMLYAICYNHG